MRRLRPGVFVLVFVLMLAGCGDDDGEETPEQPATTPSPVELEPEPEQEPEPEPETEPETVAEVYEVQQGDTLWGIAERFGTSVDAIVEANGIDDPSRIFPGDELIIPPGD